MIHKCKCIFNFNVSLFRQKNVRRAFAQMAIAENSIDLISASHLMMASEMDCMPTTVKKRNQTFTVIDSYPAISGAESN